MAVLAGATYLVVSRPAADQAGDSTAPGATGETTHSATHPGTVAATRPAAVPTPSGSTGAWSDAATWPGGKVPGDASAVTIRAGHTVTLDTPARVAGLTVDAGATLRFSATGAPALESTRNVIVRGVLQMRPAAAASTQTLRFVGVDEGAYVGGGMEPLATDVGLWVVGAGKLDIRGTPKTGWTRAAASVQPGARSVRLQADPAGWARGDQLVIAPTQSPEAGEASWAGFDSFAISRVTGRTVRLAEAVRRPHPIIDGQWGPEVMNLTRNVRIEGTRPGRAHIFIRSSQPQTVAYAQLRYLGPRQPDSEGFTSSVIGRYGLHFHMSGEGSRGSEVVGTVVRDTGAHAYVPHDSHGITFRDTISYNTFDDAYWWDLSPDTRTSGPETHDTLFDHAIAARVRYDPDFRGFRLTGFNLAQGVGNEIRESVAVGVQGNGGAGFHWPESTGAHGHGVWKFERGNVAHNNRSNGLSVWQNDDLPHLIRNFVAYHNGASGIDHGAYGNAYQFLSGTLYGNADGAVLLRATSSQKRLAFGCMVMDGAGISDYLLVGEDHTFSGLMPPTLVANSTFRGARRAAVALESSEHNEPYALDLVNPTMSGNEFRFGDGVPADSFVRVKTASGAYKAVPAAAGGGIPVAAWRGRKMPTAAFTTPQLGCTRVGAPALP